MLNFSPEKLVMIAILALLVLGPNRLPAAARTAGRLLAEVRRMTGSVQGELRDALAEPREALEHAAREFGVDPARAGGLRSSLAAGVRDAVVGAPAAAAATPGAAPAAQAPASRPATPAGDPPAPDDPALN